MTPTSDGNSVDVQYDRSNAKLDAWAEQHGVPQIIVATGFIAKNPKVRLSSSGICRTYVALGPHLSAVVLPCKCICVRQKDLDRACIAMTAVQLTHYLCAASPS